VQQTVTGSVGVIDPLGCPAVVDTPQLGAPAYETSIRLLFVKVTEWHVKSLTKVELVNTGLPEQLGSL
jgi:hypothetical protein